eukprot:4334613-Pyramimonas_sp.AAC.1
MSPKSRPLVLQEVSQETPESPNSLICLSYFSSSLFSAFRLHNVPMRPERPQPRNASGTAPEGGAGSDISGSPPKESPGGRKRPQEAPRSLQEVSRNSPGAPKRAPRLASEGPEMVGDAPGPEDCPTRLQY